MISEIFVASQNKGKIEEITKVLSDADIKILSVLDFPNLLDFDVEEIGVTFRENALLKAKAFAKQTNLPTLADDSGLEVFALEMKPGVKSARWVSGSDQDRIDALLSKLEQVTDRRAQFRTVLCWYLPKSENEVFFEGVVRGNIATQPSGDYGFGYDPVFMPEGYKQTFAQLGEEIKNQLSHRAIALKKFKNYIALENN